MYYSARVLRDACWAQLKRHGSPRSLVQKASINFKNSVLFFGSLLCSPADTFLSWLPGSEPLCTALQCRYSTLGIPIANTVLTAFSLVKGKLFFELRIFSKHPLIHCAFFYFASACLLCRKHDLLPSCNRTAHACCVHSSSTNQKRNVSAMPSVFSAPQWLPHHCTFYLEYVQHLQRIGNSHILFSYLLSDSRTHFWGRPCLSWFCSDHGIKSLPISFYLRPVQPS